jgi:hypothetical protein
MSERSQNKNPLWGGTVISALEHASELVSDLNKFGIRGYHQGLDRVNEPIVDGELGVSRILSVEPFRDLFGRAV